MPQRGSQRLGSSLLEMAGGTVPQRATATLLTAGALGALFVVYSVATACLKPSPAGIEPPSVAGVSAPVLPPDDTVAISRKFLSDHAWTATAGLRGQTHDNSMFYYFNDYDQKSEKVVRFVPFAMVVRMKDSKPSDPPYTVVSDSADVEFGSKVDLPLQNPGPVVRAGLRGKVVIRGPKGVVIHGRNFTYDREAKRIYSDNRVQFQFDRHSGSAKGVQLELIEKPGAKPDESMAIAGISSVKLLQYVDMTLIPNPPKAAPARKESALAGPRIVHVHSDGSFNFVLASRVATFERNVNVFRESSPGKSDRLFSDQRLEIVFDDKQAPAAAGHPAALPASPLTKPGKPAVAAAPGAAAENPVTGALDPNLSFKSVHAEGKTVSLVSEEQELRATMRDFRYDQLAREATLSGGGERVRVLHRRDRLRSPEIRLVHDEKGGAITHVWCRGAGDMLHFDEKSKVVDLNVEWRKEMRKQPEPDPRSPFDRIDLEEAIIEQPKDSAGIAASHMRLWVVRDGAARPVATGNAPPSPRNTRNAPRLDHMLAWKNVAMVSPQFEAEGKRLEVWFEAADPGRPKVAPTARRSRANLAPTDLKIAAGTRPAAANSPTNAGPRPGRAAVSAPGTGPRPTDIGPKNGKTPPDEPYSLNAEQMHVRVIQGEDGEKAKVAEVIAEGSACLTQSHGDKASPLIIDGNKLVIQNRGETDQDMHIFGQPAHVRDRGSEIEGNRIHFDRQQNTADVDGAGRLRLPVKSQGALADAPAKPLDVVWQRSMHFNGKTADFVGKVRTTMDDAESKSQVRSRTLSVTLDRTFSFTQDRKGDAPPDVETIACSGGIEFDSESSIKGHVMEVRRGTFADLVFHRSSGESQATGPGLLRVWRHTQNGRSGISQLANTRSNSPPQARKSTAWEFMQITFDGRMDGRRSPAEEPAPPQEPRVRTVVATNSILGGNGSWTSRFYDNVQVLYGPVDQLMEIVNRDELDDQSGFMRSEILEVIQHPQSRTVDAHVTLKAEHNAQIEGKQYHGEAETITYDGSKSIYRLHGDSDRQARLAQQLQVGADWSETNSYVVVYDTLNHRVKLEGTGKIDVFR